MKKNRSKALIILVIIIFAILFGRLFQLTIIKGEYFRQQADNFRMKQINIKAPRGNIYDANGKLLAGNKSAYNLNVYKDRFNSLSKDQKNRILAQIVGILEKDGSKYIEDYFFEIYDFIYKDKNDYFSEDNLPTQKVINLIKDNDLLEQILRSKYLYNLEKNETFYPLDGVIYYLQQRGKNIPLKIVDNGAVSLEFVKGKDYDRLIESNLINNNTTAFKFLMDNIKEDDSLLYDLLGKPLNRKIIYEILKEHNLQDNIEISDLTFTNDIQFIENKAKLHVINPEITLTSNPKDDFLNLVKSNGLDELLYSYSVNEDKTYNVAVEKLISMLKDKGEDPEVSYSINEDENRVELKNEKGDENPIDVLISLVNKYEGLLDSFIIDPDIVSLAENGLFNKSIYPRINKTRWIYTYTKEKEEILNTYGLDINTSPDDLFKELKDNYEIKNYSDYEAFSIISLLYKIQSQGYYAYMPLTISTSVSEDTLLKIEESIPKEYGFEVVQEPMRYYPNANLASHVIGYIGKISENFEVEKYVEHKQYSKNDKIGKVGLEESFEDTLKGSDGKKIVNTDVLGNTTDIIEETPSVPGNNLYTTIDKKYQEEAEKIVEDMILSKNSGEEYKSFIGDYFPSFDTETETAATVAMDAKTGEILAMVSKPDFDPNIFVNGVSEYDWARLNDVSSDYVYSAKPLMNLVTQSAMPPGSTFKLVVSLAALEKGLDPNDTITCYGYIDIGDTRFNCLIYTNSGTTHGAINLYDALKVSCNYYFYSLALGENPKQANDVDVKVTLDDLNAVASDLGLGKKTGIEINYPSEAIGSVPSITSKKSTVKIMLRNFLDKNLMFFAKDKSMTQTQHANNIKEILSWVDEENIKSYQSVLNDLTNMGYIADQKVDGVSFRLGERIRYSYISQAQWTDGDSLNMSIGQGQNLYTPLQMLQVVNTIANRGEKIKPTLVKKITDFSEKNIIYKNEVEKTVLDKYDKKYYEDIIEGMYRTRFVHTHAMGMPVEIAAKTGTAETGMMNPKTGQEYKPFTWEVAFAPKDDPQIAVVSVIIQGSNSSDPAVICDDMIYAYYKYVKKDPSFTGERNDKIYQNQ